MGNKKQVYPLFYYCKHGTSDRDFILKRMQIVPEAEKYKVSREYEKLFLSGENGARKTANTFLNDTAKAYRQELLKKRK